MQRVSDGKRHFSERSEKILKPQGIWQRDGSDPSEICIGCKGTGIMVQKNFIRSARRNIFILLIFLGASCGYRVQSSVKSLPAGLQSLGIPTFKNNTNQYKIEQQITAALLKEFSRRTRTPVNSKSTGVDAVLVGEIMGISSNPGAFGTQENTTVGSAFLISVQIGVKLIRLKDSAVLYENGNFIFRERYTINSSLNDFFSEENPALQRLASDFASSLAGTVLETAKP
jgi:hypothetical protein